MRTLKDLETKIQELKLESEEVAKLAKAEVVHQLMRFFILNIDKFTIQKYEQGQRFGYESGTEYVYTGNALMTIPGLSGLCAGTLYNLQSSMCIRYRW